MAKQINLANFSMQPKRPQCLTRSFSMRSYHTPHGTPDRFPSGWAASQVGKSGAKMGTSRMSDVGSTKKESAQKCTKVIHFYRILFSVLYTKAARMGRFGGT